MVRLLSISDLLIKLNVSVLNNYSWFDGFMQVGKEVKFQETSDVSKLVGCSCLAAFMCAKLKLLRKVSVFHACFSSNISAQVCQEHLYLELT